MQATGTELYMSGSTFCPPTSSCCSSVPPARSPGPTFLTAALLATVSPVHHTDPASHCRCVPVAATYMLELLLCLETPQTLCWGALPA